MGVGAGFAVVLLALAMSTSWARDEAIQTDVTSERRDVIALRCADLRMGQYWCAEPVIDPATQQPANCTREGRARVPCYPVADINCSVADDDGSDGDFIVHDGSMRGLDAEVSCHWTGEKRFSVALLLSVFLGMLGVDRFYLGYPAIGLLKLCTLGGMLLGQLLDILLIALQIVGPSDGSAYIVDYYGPALHPVRHDNATFLKPQYDAAYDAKYEL